MLHRVSFLASESVRKFLYYFAIKKGNLSFGSFPTLSRLFQASLRWHYPNQVMGRRLFLPLSLQDKLPFVFTCKFYYIPLCQKWQDLQMAKTLTLPILLALQKLPHEIRKLLLPPGPIVVHILSPEINPRRHSGFGRSVCISRCDSVYGNAGRADCVLCLCHSVSDFHGRRCDFVRYSAGGITENRDSENGGSQIRR